LAPLWLVSPTRFPRSSRLGNPICASVVPFRSAPSSLMIWVLFRLLSVSALLLLRIARLLFFGLGPFFPAPSTSAPAPAFAPRCPLRTHADSSGKQAHGFCSLDFGAIPQQLVINGGVHPFEGAAGCGSLSERQMWPLVGFDGQPWWTLMVSPCIARIVQACYKDIRPAMISDSDLG